MGSLYYVASAPAVAVELSLGHMQLLRLQTFTRGNIVVSSQPLAARSSKLLCAAGPSLQFANMSRDLGLLYSAKKRRFAALQRKRLTASRVRLKRVGRLTGLTKAARVLITTGAVPQALWGVENAGMAPNVRVALRS